MGNVIYTGADYERWGENMKNKKKVLLLGTVCLFIVAFTGCGLLRQEEEVRNQITIPSYDASGASFGYVKRGDLENAETLFLKLTTTEEHELYFGVSGISIDKVYIKEGDGVRAGQLLAELQSDDIKNEIASLEAKKETIALDIQHTRQLLEETRQRKEYIEEKEDARQESIGRYQLQLQQLDNDMQETEGARKEQESKLKKHRIYADIDGTVARVSSYGGGFLSDEKQAFLTLQSAAQQFSGNTKAENDFESGQKVIIILNEEEYPAQILRAERAEGVTEVDVCLQEGYSVPEDCTYGELLWSTGVVKDALYVPKKAIVIVGEKSYVYKMGEDGFANPVEIQTGTVNTDYVQITAGVEQDDTVMLYE